MVNKINICSIFLKVLLAKRSPIKIGWYPTVIQKIERGTFFLSKHSVILWIEVEKQRAELERELDDINDRLEEAGGNVQAQVCATSDLFIFSQEYIN